MRPWCPAPPGRGGGGVARCAVSQGFPVGQVLPTELVLPGAAAERGIAQQPSSPSVTTDDGDEFTMVEPRCDIELGGNQLGGFVS